MGEVKVFKTDTPFCNRNCGTGANRCIIFDTCKYKIPSRIEGWIKGTVNIRRKENL